MGRQPSPVMKSYCATVRPTMPSPNTVGVVMPASAARPFRGPISRPPLRPPYRPARGTQPPVGCAPGLHGDLPRVRPGLFVRKLREDVADVWVAVLEHLRAAFGLVGVETE